MHSSTHMLSMLSNWIFQQDGATMVSRQECYCDGMASSVTRSQSNREYVGHLKRVVQEKNPANMGEFWTAINDAWKEFPHDRLVNLIDSMPKRCEEVIKAKGVPTSY